MSDIDAKISAIKSRRDAAQLAMMRAQAAKENAEAAEDAAMHRLLEEFGLDNLADARAMLAKLESDVQNLMDEVTRTLDDIEL